MHPAVRFTIQEPRLFTVNQHPMVFTFPVCRGLFLHGLKGTQHSMALFLPLFLPWLFYETFFTNGLTARASLGLLA